MDRETAEAYALGFVGAVQGVSRYYVKPEVEKAIERTTVPENGLYGWGLIAAGVVAYDYLAIRDGKETLSHAFHRGMEHPVMKFMCIGALGATALHLANVLPRKYDLFYGFKEDK